MKLQSLTWNFSLCLTIGLIHGICLASGSPSNDFPSTFPPLPTEPQYQQLGMTYSTDSSPTYQDLTCQLNQHRQHILDLIAQADNEKRINDEIKEWLTDLKKTVDYCFHIIEQHKASFNDITQQMANDRQVNQATKNEITQKIAAIKRGQLERQLSEETTIVAMQRQLSDFSTLISQLSMHAPNITIKNTSSSDNSNYSKKKTTNTDKVVNALSAFPILFATYCVGGSKAAITVGSAMILLGFLHTKYENFMSKTRATSDIIKAVMVSGATGICLSVYLSQK